ncbi:unnamed protein product [Amoebophrya sp. A25]|nr:unnamed protein product [Amoebophrya sp. A25]|eukprot:GSA25T00019928001.1
MEMGERKITPRRRKPIKKSYINEGAQLGWLSRESSALGFLLCSNPFVCGDFSCCVPASTTDHSFL